MNQGHYKMTLQSNCNDPGSLQIGHGILSLSDIKLNKEADYF